MELNSVLEKAERVCDEVGGTQFRRHPGTEGEASLGYVRGKWTLTVVTRYKNKKDEQVGSGESPNAALSDFTERLNQAVAAVPAKAVKAKAPKEPKPAKEPKAAKVPKAAKGESAAASA